MITISYQNIGEIILYVHVTCYFFWSTNFAPKIRGIIWVDNNMTDGVPSGLPDPAVVRIVQATRGDSSFATNPSGDLLRC